MRYALLEFFAFSHSNTISYTVECERRGPYDTPDEPPCMIARWSQLGI